jgi:hypothetical protein
VECGCDPRNGRRGRQQPYDLSAAHWARLRRRVLALPAGAEILSAFLPVLEIPLAAFEADHLIGKDMKVLRTQMSKVGSTGRRRAAPKVVRITGGMR